MIVITENSAKKILSFLQILHFPLNMSYAIENVWITALMITYATPDHIDAFIWIIPNILSILLRPYFIRIVHKNQSNLFVQFSLVQLFMLLGGLGCGLISLSIFPQNWILNIVICTVGWTMMDVGFQLCQFMAEKLGQRLKNKFPQIQINDKSESNAFYGLVAGYIISFSLCFLQKKKSKKSFFKNCAYAYFICLIFIICVLAYIFEKKSFKIFTQISIERNQVVNFAAQPGFYLPGYYEFKAASFQDKFLIFMRFLSLYMVDTVLIYGSMWIVYGFSEMGYKQGASLKDGIKYGSILLLIYTIISSINIRLDSTKTHIQKYTLIMASIALVSFYTFLIQSYFFGAVLLSMLIGLSENIFTNYIQPVWNQNPIFQVTGQLTKRIQSIFILCPMPFISMIVLRRDDILDCIIWVNGMIVFGLILFLFSSDQVRKLFERKRKVSKIE